MVKIALHLSLLIGPQFTWASAPADGSAGAESTARAVSEACKDFSADNMKDPNSPCYEDIRGSLDVRQAEGIFYDPLIVKEHKDECNGCQVLSNIEIGGDTITNTYNVPFFKAAVPSGNAPPDVPVGDDKGGTN